jgi:hypothetical protein
MAVRAKFRCTVVEDYGYSKKVKLTAACARTQDELGGENDRFNKATPSGEMWMTIDNPAASIQFEPGKHYYLDFSEAPE